MLDYFNDFLAQCLESKRIPLKTVKEKGFITRLKGRLRTTNRYSEALHYSRNKNLQVKVGSRESAKIYIEDKEIFENNSDDSTKLYPKRRIDLGANDQSGYLETPPEDNTRGSRFTALQIFEKLGHQKLNFDVMITRYSLVKLLLIPHERVDLSLNLVAFDGQLFIDSERTRPQKMTSGKGVTCGHTFEKLMSRKKDMGITTETQKNPQTKNDTEKYISMVKLSLDYVNREVLVPSEIDALKPAGDLFSSAHQNADVYDLLEYVELKTFALNSKRSLLLSIIQCYLADTRIMCVGYRDKNNILEYIKKYDIQYLLSESISEDLTLQESLDIWLCFIVEFLVRATSSMHSLTTPQYYILQVLRGNINLIYRKPKHEDIEEILPKEFFRWRKYGHSSLNTV